MDNFNALDRIRELCRERNWSFYQLAKASGIAYSTLHTMLTKNNMPSLSTLQKLCDGFGITLAEFFDSKSGLEGLTDEQRLCLSLFSALPEEDRRLAIAYLKGLSKKL